MILRKIA